MDMDERTKMMTPGGRLVDTPPPSESVTGLKVCVKCGRDVSGQKRMKDAEGNYWCFDCGEHERQVREGVTLCPVCNRQVNPMYMVKVKEQYICEACSTRPAVRRASAVGGREKVLGLLLLLAVAAWAVAKYVLGVV